MCTYIYKHIRLCIFFLIYCILSNGEVIKYHIFISVVVIDLSVRCLNTGPGDRLGAGVSLHTCCSHATKSGFLV